MLEDFYKDFHPLVDKGEEADRAEAAQTRLLGQDPKSGKPSLCPIWPLYGPRVAAPGEAEPADKDNKDIPKPKFAPMPAGAELLIPLH